MANVAEKSDRPSKTKVTALLACCIVKSMASHGLSASVPYEDAPKVLDPESVSTTVISVFSVRKYLEYSFGDMVNVS